MTPMEMHDLDRTHGSAITVATPALTMIVTLMPRRPNGTTVQVIVVEALAQVVRDGAEATLRVEIQVYGSQGVQVYFGFVVPKRKTEPKSADKFEAI